MPLARDSSTAQVASPHSLALMVKLIHYAVVAVLVVGALYYLWVKPPTLNPMVDPQAAEALALVQTHRASGIPDHSSRQ